jgi:AraC-like DNA-binding protein
MPSSSVCTFTEPDEYALAMRQGTVGLTVKQRGSFSAKLTRIDLHSLWMQRFSATLGWTSHIDYWGEQATIAFQTRPGLDMARNGQEFAYTSVARLNASQSYYLHSPGPASYATMSLPLNELASLGSVVGRDLTQPKDLLSVTPPPDALARVRRLHETAGCLAEDAPAVLAHPEGARGLEQALIEAMLDCLGGGEIEEDRTAQKQHAAIMRRFHRVIEENPDEPLYITEICKAVGASSRTLNVCCQEHLGMAPKHYLLLRRMHLVRRGLRESTSADTTVTEIATRYGFWQFGRLAVKYKSLFGEAPSATLARPPHH